MYKINLTNHSLRSALLLGAASAAAIGLSAPAFAQDSTETVVVTGSRIPQTGLYSASPTTVIGSQEIQLEGAVNSEQLLNALPQNIGGETSGFDISSDGTTTVSLRGLGSNRTLVLVDGKRYVPSGVGGSVDLDAIPPGMIDHVDVVTGGASAVYGSDAIAGVVNIVLKKDFEGAEATGTYSAYPDYDLDGETADFNGLIGFSSGDGKGNVTMFGGFTHRTAISQASRSFGALPLETDDAGHFFVLGSGSTPAGNFYPASGPHAAPFAGGDGGFCYQYNGPNATNNNFGIYKFTNLGTAACSTLDNAEPAPGDTFNFNPYQLNQTEQTRYNFGANGHYEVNKQLDFYSRVMYSDTKINTQIAPAPTSFFTFNVNADNPFLSGQEKDLLFGTPAPAPGTPDASIYLAKRLVDFGPRRTEFDFNSYEMVFGAKGDLGNSWSYDASAQYGQTTSTQFSTGFVSYANLQDEIDVVSNGAGGFECRSGHAGCVPYNIYNLDPSAPGQISPGAIAYAGVPTFETTKATESVITASLAGDFGSWGLQSPWAKSPVSMAIGAEYREESGDTRTDEVLQTGNALGLSGKVLPVHGAFNVSEGFTEVKIPVVEGMPFFEDLELEGAYRYSSYNIAGATSTYKYGGSWAPTQDFKFRALAQRAVRAPNISELFASDVIGLNSGTDPCQASQNPGSVANLQALCIATGAHAGQGATCNAGQCNVLVGGNPSLKPEVADTKTLGVVFTPSFFDGFTATVDYYNINLSGAVGSYLGSPQGVFDACYKPAGGITNVAAQAATPACVAIVRDATGGFRTPTGYIYQLNFNTGLLHPTGIDVELNYQTDLANMGGGPDWGSVAFNLNGTYQLSFKQQGAPGATEFDCAGLYGNECGVPDPKYRFNLRMNWTDSSGDVLISGRWRYIGSSLLDSDEFSICHGVVTPCTPTGAPFDLTDHKIPSVSYFDFTGVWNLRQGLSLTAGLQNAFNKKPPLVSSDIDANANNSNTFPGVYDIQGRLLFVSGTVKF